MRNTEIIIATGIKLDKTYRNVLDYTNEKMLNLLEENVIYHGYDFSFIRNIEKNAISVNGVSYNDLLYANYFAYKNTDYADKWFFCFIDSIEYVSDKTTRIYFTVDVHTTWWENWTKTKCYVEREHPEDDTLGVNTLVENINVDNYNTEEIHSIDVNPNRICLMFTEARAQKDKYISPYLAWKGRLPQMEGDIPFNGNLPMTLWRVDNNITQDGVSGLLKYYSDYITEGKGDDLVSIFTYHLKKTNPDYVDIPKITTIGGYTPKWNKCLIYPFVKITLTNEQGSSVELRQEDFGGNIKFQYDITYSFKGQSFCYPLQYKDIERNFDFGLLIDNYPVIPMTKDSYAEYIAQNKSAMAFSAINAGVSALTTVATGNPLGVIAAAQSFGNIATSIDVAKTKPDTIKGGVGGDYINTALDNFRFNIEINTAKLDVIKQADDFFEKYGYSTNRYKEPNFYSKEDFNYIKIGGDSNIGSGNLPYNAMEEINNIYRNGVTLWHNHSLM